MESNHAIMENYFRLQNSVALDEAAMPPSLSLVYVELEVSAPDIKMFFDK